MTCDFVFYYHHFINRFTDSSQKLISLLLLCLLSSNVMAQSPTYAQYSESACLLIADQVKRFEQQPNLPSYQDALKNYRRHCQQPVPQQPKPYSHESTLGQQDPTTKTPASPAVMTAPIAPINHVVQPLQATTGADPEPAGWAD